MSTQRTRADLKKKVENTFYELNTECTFMIKKINALWAWSTPVWQESAPVETSNGRSDIYLM